METDPDGQPYPIQEYHFDFFNYAGIDRPVRLVVTDPVHIESLRADPAELGGAWRIDYAMTLAGETATIEVELRGPDGEVVGTASGAEGSISIPEPRLWQPGAPRLYTLIARLRDARGAVLDEYALETGLRTVEVRPDSFLINGQPFYFTGFGKHEDFHIHGKGLNLPLLVRDFELLKWIGANSVRTTHYPYSEEFLQMADRTGLVVIGECPAVGQNKFRGADPVFVEGRINGASLIQHKKTLGEMIHRDRHHPCIVMWSLGNEPASGDEGAEAYFAEVTDHTRKLDAYRPLTIVETIWWNNTRVAKFCDVICINRYFGWYLKTGHLPLIQEELKKDLENWHREYNKPVIIAEYGADTVAGLHQHPPVMFSEEFQEEFLRLYHEVFDQCPWVVGEHVWNFADFATKQGTSRVGGNRKGIFTRERQPKAAARLLRERWLRKAPAPRPPSSRALTREDPHHPDTAAFARQDATRK
jgi:beta-glucuronidase